MTPPRHGPLLTLFVVLSTLGSTAPAQEGDGIRNVEVKEILQACKGASAARIWALSDKLVAKGNAAKRYIRDALKDTSIEGRICGLRALIELDSPTYAVEKLMDLAADENLKDDFRVLALGLVGSTEEIDAEEGLVELLVSYNPKVRIAAARALWTLEGEHAHKAKAALIEFLKSSDAELQAQGALALAEMGDITTPGVRDILMRLRKQPGDRGKLANALYARLQLQKVIAFYERRGDAAAANKRRAGPWRHLDEMVALLKRYYDAHDDEDLDEDTLRARAAAGMVQFPADPHTVFMSPEMYGEFLHGADGVDPSYGGIGAFINTNVKDRFEILRPIFGGPAWNSNIRGGDVIIAVNGKPIRGRSTTDIIKQIKGPAGTPVILTIVREGWREPRDIKVIRARIMLPSVQARLLPGRIGYIAITQYSHDTGKELWQALTKLEADGLRGLVIDVRNNPGGLLDTVKQCLSLFLREKELICTVKGRAYPPEPHQSSRSDHERTYPISILVNRASASGAELMSGVLQHYSKISKLTAEENTYVDALVLGESTFGKGTVQHTRALDSWPGEKFTDRPRRNGRYDPGEPFTDANSNGRRDSGEGYTDIKMRNRRWDDAEPWEDTNGNSTRDENEKFTDQNNDGEWDAAEPFQDVNGNRRYDEGAALKLTVARYYLPGGKNFTRRRVWTKETK